MTLLQSIVRRSYLPILIVAMAGLLAGCCSESKKPTAQTTQLAIASGLTAPHVDEDLKTAVTPPVGWLPEAPKISASHRHQIWMSPTKNTAYGVIYFKLPLPVGLNLAFNGFMKQMKASEGEANLLHREDDDKLPGLRFIAEGGLYTIRGNMTVSGFHGWVVYAGTIRSKPVDFLELHQAENAREQTLVDQP